MSDRKARVLLWVVVLCGLALGYATCTADPVAVSIVERVPLGSGIDALEVVKNDSEIRNSSVVQWLQVSPPRTRQSSGPSLPDGKNANPPSFHRKELGVYSYWGLHARVGDDFTGEVMFFTLNEIIVFTFTKGKLVRKGWGFLPG